MGHENTYHIETGLSSGMGLFQDIQVPMSYTLDERADGRPLGQDHRNHFGVPIIGRLSFSLEREFYGFGIKTSLQYLPAFDASRGSLNASYRRMELIPYAEKSWSNELKTSLGLNRQVASFINGSSQHFIESYMPMVSLLMFSDDLNWSLYGDMGYSIFSQFGMDGNIAKRSEKYFKSSEVNVFHHGLGVNYIASEVTEVFLSFNHEMSKIIIHQPVEYRTGFGLVNAVTEEKIKIDLNTLMIEMGYRKSI